MEWPKSCKAFLRIPANSSRFLAICRAHQCRLLSACTAVTAAGTGRDKHLLARIQEDPRYRMGQIHIQGAAGISADRLRWHFAGLGRPLAGFRSALDLRDDGTADLVTRISWEGPSLLQPCFLRRRSNPASALTAMADGSGMLSTMLSYSAVGKGYPPVLAPKNSATALVPS